MLVPVHIGYFIATPHIRHRCEVYYRFEEHHTSCGCLLNTLRHLTSLGIDARQPAVLRHRHLKHDFINLTLVIGVQIMARSDARRYRLRQDELDIPVAEPKERRRSSRWSLLGRRSNQWSLSRRRSNRRTRRWIAPVLTSGY